MVVRQFLFYVAVGVLSAVIDIGSMQLLLGAGMAYQGAVSAGFMAGLVFNYTAHQRLTFRARHSTGTLVRFAILLALNYALTLFCVELALHFFEPVLTGKLISLPVVAINGFLLGRYWVFRKKDRTHG
jgi:putative flippase GtrA